MRPVAASLALLRPCALGGAGSAVALLALLGPTARHRRPRRPPRASGSIVDGRLAGGSRCAPACATGDPGTGLDALTTAGFTLRLRAPPAGSGLPDRRPARVQRTGSDTYWSYWYRAKGSSRWVYASTAPAPTTRSPATPRPGSGRTAASASRPTSRSARICPQARRRRTATPTPTRDQAPSAKSTTGRRPVPAAVEPLRTARHDCAPAPEAEPGQHPLRPRPAPHRPSAPATSPPPVPAGVASTVRRSRAATTAAARRGPASRSAPSLVGGARRRRRRSAARRWTAVTGGLARRRLQRAAPRRVVAVGDRPGDRGQPHHQPAAARPGRSPSPATSWPPGAPSAVGPGVRLLPADGPGRGRDPGRLRGALRRAGAGHRAVHLPEVDRCPTGRPASGSAAT